MAAPTKISRAQTSIVETTALIVVIVIVGWFFVRPQTVVLKEAKSRLAQAETAFKNVEKDKSDLTQLTALLKQSQADILLVDEALPLQNRPTQLEVLLDSLVSASGLAATDVSLHQEENSIAAGNKALLSNPFSVTRKLRVTTVDLTVEGDIDEFRNLLQLLETNGRLIDVTALTMVNESDKIVFKIKLKAYNYVP